MPTHHFTLIVDGTDLQDESVIDRLFEAGCDDALVGSTDGVQFIDFDRDAASLDVAVLSAVSDVEQVSGVQVIRLAGAGLVSIADIAARVGRTRESVRLLVSGARGPGNFPAPVTDPRARYRLWRWADVQRWFEGQFGEDALGAREEHLRSAINACLELRQEGRRLDDGERDRLLALAGLEGLVADVRVVAKLSL